MIAGIKVVTIIGWLAILVNLVNPFGGQIETILHWSGIGLFVAHAVEAFIYLPLMKKVGGSIPAHMTQVLIFGVGHFLIMQNTLKSQEA